jgi:hypothetical protein
MRALSRSILLLALSLASACSGAPEGVWVVGQIENPRSNHKGFPAESWAAQAPEGAEILLAPGGAIFGAAAAIESARLNGGWRGRTVEFSWEGVGPRGVTSVFRFAGAYDPNRDAIAGILSQEIKLGPVSALLSGEVALRRRDSRQ